MRVIRVALIAALMFWMLPVAALAASAPPPLFDTPPAVRAASSGVSSRATVRQRPVASRLGVLVRSDGSPALGAGDRLELNLFDDARFSMTVSEVARHAGHGLTWNGTLDGVDLGSAALAVYDGALVGQVWTPAAVYRIGHAPDGTPVVEEIDQAKLPREGDAIAPPATGGEMLDADASPAAGDTASQIDVMVLYTAAARAAAGGTAAMRAQAVLAVATSNTAYGNNDLVQRLRLVYSGEVPITETADFNADLNTLRANPTVGWLRDMTRADLVSMLVDHGQGAPLCGIAFVMRTNAVSFAINGFSVVERDCASSNLSFPHELGHNMGAHHDVFVIGTDTGLDPYSHGWVDLVGKFRTVMAYNDQCANSTPTFNCTRIPYFSTPDKTFNGRVVGNAVTADNSRTLSESAPTVANFRQALTSPLSIAATVNQPTIGVGQMLVASVSLNYAGGLGGTADFYAGLMLQDGTAVFFTSVAITPTSGYALGNVTNFASYRPIATGIPLGAPFAATLSPFLSYPRQAGDPTGGLAFFVLAVKSGAQADGVLAPDELISASLAPFTFPATSPGDTP
jgi:hypothetical protein